MSGTKQIGVVNSVTQRQVQKADQSMITIYEAETSLGKMTTTRVDIANSALSLVGVTAEIEYAVTTKPNPRGGVYTNYYLNGILPAGTNVVQQAQQAQQTFAGSTIPPVGSVIPAAEEKTVGDFKDISIWRQVATKVAAELDPKTPEDFWATTGALYHYYSTGQFPMQQAMVNQLGATEIPQQSSDDDIPF